MRTKTLLLAAAISVAGFVSSKAATVYSQNVVGYINVTIQANKFSFIGNQLVNGSDVSKTNNDIQAILQSGLVSDANFSSNTTLYYWNGAGYNLYYYFKNSDAANQFDPTFGDGWYDGSGNFVHVPLLQGTNGGNFIKNRASSPITITMVGQVLQGTNVYGIKPGFNTYTLSEPVSTNLNSSLINFPGTSDAAFAHNDVYYHYKADGSGYDILYYFTDIDAQNQFDPTFGNGWYDGAGNYGSANPALWPKVGEGFFINHRVGTTALWTNVFNVQ